MKLSVSLPGEDVEFLDSYAKAHALASRSAVLHHAVRALHMEDLRQSYGPAWDEWAAGDAAAAWDPTVGDGL